MNGWIKLHRKFRENPIYTNSHAVHVWIECLLRASRKPQEFYMRREKIFLQEGQFIMGRAEFGQSIGMSGSTAWFWLNQFKLDSMIDITPIHGKGTVVTVLRWNEYQVVDTTVDTEKTQDEHRMNTYKNDKNVKNIGVVNNNTLLNTDTIQNSGEQKFQQFWEIYDKKIDPNRCRDYWFGRKSIRNKKKIQPKDWDSIIEHTKEYVENTYKEDKYPTRKHPATYLYNSGWLDEIIKIKQTAKQPERKFVYK